MVKNTASIKEKTTGILGSISGFTSIIGSWQICHNLCLALITILSVIGITVTGMPLLFLTTITKPLWIIAVILLLVTFLLYLKKKCISSRLLLFNLGLIIAGVPFQPLQKLSLLFWIIGGIIALTSIVLYINDKIKNRREKHEKRL